MSCSPAACDAAWLTWSKPERLGYPPLHKYKLERWRAPSDSSEPAKWETANGDLDADDGSWQDTSVQVRTAAEQQLLLCRPDRR